MDYGRLFSSSNVAKQLKILNKDYEGRRTWAELYGNVGLSEQRSINQAKLDYSQNIADAYASSRRQQGLLMNSNLGSGFKQQGLQDIESSLQQAYNSYRQQYLTQQSDIQSTAEQARASINEALNTEATNTKAYIDSFYDYIANLHERSLGTEDVEADEYLAKLFGSDVLWSRYTNTVLDDEGNPITLTDAEGNEYNQTTLLSKQELLSQFYDDKGNITDRGKSFYDQMLNALSSAEGSKYSFGSYLSEANPELFEWLNQPNPYDYTSTGTKEGTIKTMLGLDASDAEYSVKDAYKGMTDKEVEKYFVSDLVKPSDLEVGKTKKSNVSVYSIEHTPEILDLQIPKSSIDAISRNVSKMNLSDVMSESLGEDINTYLDDLSKLESSMSDYAIEKEYSKIYKNYDKKYVYEAVTGYDYESRRGQGVLLHSNVQPDELLSSYRDALDTDGKKSATPTEIYEGLKIYLERYYKIKHQQEYVKSYERLYNAYVNALNKK